MTVELCLSSLSLSVWGTELRSCTLLLHPCWRAGDQSSATGHCSSVGAADSELGGLGVQEAPGRGLDKRPLQPIGEPQERRFPAMLGDQALQESTLW